VSREARNGRGEARQSERKFCNCKLANFCAKMYNTGINIGFLVFFPEIVNP
jgi:hypothetical protein